MREVLSLLMFSIKVLCFVVFFAALKPNAVSVAHGPSGPAHCSTEYSSKPVCRPHMFAARSWSAVAE
jgi:hypothetical protein